MANPWFKFYGAEYLADPKIDQLTPQERSCWLTLLSLTNVAGDSGVVHNLKIFTLLTRSGIYPLDSAGEQMGLKDDYTDTLGVLEHFEALGMVERIDAFSYRIKNWEKRQETALTAAERQAKYRESKKSNENVTERVTKVTLDKNREEEIREDIGAEEPREVVEEEENPRVKSKPKYPHALEVFSWFPNRQKSWESLKNTQEREYAEYLYERGEETVKKALRYCEAHKDDDMFYKITKPSDLEKKWEDIRAYAKRNS